MITNNGAQLLSNIKLANLPLSTEIYDETNTLISTSNYGTTSYAYGNCSRENRVNPIPQSYVSNAQGMTMRLGFDDTPETINDYSLDSDMSGTDVNTIVKLQSSTVNWSPNTTLRGSLVYTYTFVNTGNTPITIKEIGLFFVNYMCRFLCARKVISPRTIEAGGVATFNYEIGCNQGS